MFLLKNDFVVILKHCFWRFKGKISRNFFWRMKLKFYFEKLNSFWRSKFMQSWFKARSCTDDCLHEVYCLIDDDAVVPWLDFWVITVIQLINDCRHIMLLSMQYYKRYLSVESFLLNEHSKLLCDTSTQLWSDISSSPSIYYIMKSIKVIEVDKKINF